MATPDHTPHGRGYSSALHYFHHCNDYWTYDDGPRCKVPGGDPEDLIPVVDLWQTNLEQPGMQGPAHGYNNSCVGGMGGGAGGNSSADHGSPDRTGDTCYRHGPKSGTELRAACCFLPAASYLLLAACCVRAVNLT